MATHELAELLLSKEDTITKLGKYITNRGDTWWEEIEDIEIIFGEESTIIQEKLWK